MIGRIMPYTLYFKPAKRPFASPASLETAKDGYTFATRSTGAIEGAVWEGSYAEIIKFDKILKTVKVKITNTLFPYQKPTHYRTFTVKNFLKEFEKV